MSYSLSSKSGELHKPGPAILRNNFIFPAVEVPGFRLLRPIPGYSSLLFGARFYGKILVSILPHGNRHRIGHRGHPGFTPKKETPLLPWL
jgi:hypothetical protein